MTRLLSLLPIAASLVLGPMPALAPVYEPIRIVYATAPSVEYLLVAAALRYELPVKLLVHRARCESGIQLDPQAERQENNGTVSRGIMGLNSRWFPGSEGFTVAENVDRGAAWLKTLLNRCGGDEGCAERAYRTGKVIR